MKIAVLTYSTNPRGGVVHSLYLAENLMKLGHEVHLFALDRTAQGGFFRPTAVPYTLIPCGKLPEHDFDAKIYKYIDTYAKYFLQHDMSEFDIYHAQDCISVSGLLKVREYGKKFRLLRTIHHVDDFTSPSLMHCQHNSIVAPDAHITVSNYWHERLLKEYGVTSKLIYNGIDNERFQLGDQARAKAKFHLTGKTVFLTIGGIEPRKNSLLLLQAFLKAREKLIAEGRQPVLVIGGGKTLFDYTAYRTAFMEKVNAAGLELGRDIVVTGVLAEDDVPVLYQSADCFVFPSVKEGWGMVILEALLSGIPAIVSDIPVFHEFLEPGKDALFVSPTDPDGFAAGMIDIIHQDALRYKLQCNGLQTGARYSWDETARQHAIFYKEMMMDAK